MRHARPCLGNVPAGLSPQDTGRAVGFRECVDCEIDGGLRGLEMERAQEVDGAKWTMLADEADSLLNHDPTLCSLRAE
jgi:hypothetical protein